MKRLQSNRERSILAETIVDPHFLALRSGGGGRRPRMCHSCQLGHAKPCEMKDCPCICNEPLTRRELKRMQPKAI